MVKFFNERQLKSDLQSDSNIYIFFYSPASDPCKNVYPVVLQFGENSDHIVHMVHEEEGTELQQQLNVTAYPSIVRIKNNKVLLAGLGESEVRKIIDNGKSDQ